ncbi:MAG: 50S ribosomal protein L28 [Deltaproteobacteria bacterium]|nr:50S ribosomal protein L28 [Deltaproteobacteria bacterium]
MAKCQMTGKRHMVGNRVSHANNRTKKAREANIQSKRFYIPEQGRWVRLKVSTRAIRTITKDGVLKCAKKNGVKI